MPAHWFSRLCLACGMLFAPTILMSSSADPDLMPLPVSLQREAGVFRLTPGFRVGFATGQDDRLTRAVSRTLRAWEERSGLEFSRNSSGDYLPAADVSSAGLVIECAKDVAEFPQLGEDESYTLIVTPEQVRLRAATGRGVLHGLATLQQWLQGDASGWHLPAVTIEDRPRFAWRGLMIDVCRHWQPLPVIKRNLDAMALVKLNVLHIHLTEDQGFRIESKTFPRLHEQGSDGNYFTQDEMRELIAYAADRGIRVVPEFDMPGHATSWLVGYPELGSAPGPYVIERKWGIFNPVLDPTNEETYRLLEGFLGEMAALFPDPYLHIGGDENNGVHWSANAKIQAFIREHQLKDNAGLHAWFNTRVNAILVRHGKRLVGWDEILHPDLPAGSVVHSWRGPEGIAEATARGFATILSNGYYIDLMHPTADHYLNDPIPPGSRLTPAQQSLVLGGEATMWSEWVSPETIDSRIWPRTAAIAERLWSDASVRDVPEMYRRLKSVSQRLEEAGLGHVSYLDSALRRLAGVPVSPAELDDLRAFVDLVEPVKVYQRGQQQPAATQFTPLTGVVDCARADSEPARRFKDAVDGLLKNPHSPEAVAVVEGQLASWMELARRLQQGVVSRSPRLQEIGPLLDAMREAGGIGQDALGVLAGGQPPSADWAAGRLAELKRIAQPHAAVELPFMPSIRRLIEAAAAPKL
ncbi:MAG: hypothetical protein RL091_3059 [Verrucomicrobiota bacterium]